MACSRVVLRSAGVMASLSILVFFQPSYSQQRAWFDGRVEFGDDSGEWANDGECDDPRFEGEGTANTLIGADLYRDATDCKTLLGEGRVRFRADVAVGSSATFTASAGHVERGYLEESDATLRSGEFADAYEFEGSRGDHALVELRSAEFDPYLLLRTPSGGQLDNDDYEGDSTRSLLAFDLEETGTYLVTVTSYAKGATGGYAVAIDVGAGQTAEPHIDRDGSLQAGDEMLKSGEFFDAYDFEGSPGQHVSIDLISRTFDTYLILRAPHGEQVENDDADDGGTGHSSIETDLTEDGTYRVLVTSYDTGEIGSYHLTVAPSAGDRNRLSRRNVRTFTAGQPTNGPSEGGSQRIASNRGGVERFDLLLAR